jgi:hypothetical protein
MKKAKERRFEWLDGTVTHMEELAYQRWKGDKIVQETFFYDPAQVAKVPWKARTSASWGNFKFLARPFLDRRRVLRAAEEILHQIVGRHRSTRFEHRFSTMHRYRGIQ